MDHVTAGLMPVSLQPERTLFDDHPGFDADLLAALRSSVSERTARLAARCLGWDGKGGCSLGQASREYWVTRQRVHQAVRQAKARLRGRPPSPLVVGAIEYVGARVPEVASRIECSLLADGLSTQLFRVEGLVAAAEVYGLPLRFQVGDFYGVRFVLPVGTSIHDLNRVEKAAQAQVRRWGYGLAREVVDDLAADLPWLQETSKVASVLSACPGLEWLGSVGGWFWINRAEENEPANPLLRAALRTVAVTERISIASLRSGLKRDFRRWRRKDLPEFVLRGILERSGLFRLEGGTVELKRPRDWRTELPPVAAKLAGILKERGDLPRSEFCRLACEMGVPRPTFRSFLAHLPYFERKPSGLYGLRGESG